MGTHLISGKDWWDNDSATLWERLETGGAWAGLSLSGVLRALQACKAAPTSVNLWASVAMVVPDREEVFGEEVSIASEEVCRKLW